MSYLSAVVKSPWRVVLRIKQRPTYNRNAFALKCSSGPPRVSKRCVYNDSSRAETNLHMHNTKIVSLVALISNGMFLYGNGASVNKNGIQDQVSPIKSSMATLSKQTMHSPPTTYEVLEGKELDVSKLNKEEAILTTAPRVPPQITRDYPVLLHVSLTTSTKLVQLASLYKYEQWTFNGSVPGPFIRTRVGDVVELTLTNKDQSGNPHNVDCHAFIGPGGGSALTTAEENQTNTARFKLLYPGLYLYHCAAAPVPIHIANGMYGLMYVQPADKDLPAVDKEYYVPQSEFYHEPPEVDEDGRRSSEVEFSYPNGLREEPDIVVFNGVESALTRDHPLTAKVGESVRIFFWQCRAKSFEFISCYRKQL